MKQTRIIPRIGQIISNGNSPFVMFMYFIYDTAIKKF